MTDEKLTEKIKIFLEKQENRAAMTVRELLVELKMAKLLLRELFPKVKK